MKTKMLFSAALALSLIAPVIMMADDSKPAGDADKGKGDKREFKGGSGGEDFRKHAEEMKALVEEYKTNKTEENKAKIKAKIGENIDAETKGIETRVAEMTKRLQELKDKRNTMVEERFEKIVSFGDKAGKAKERGERKNKKDSKDEAK